MLRLKAVQLAIESFSKAKQPRLIHIQIDNMTALTSLVKKERNKKSGTEFNSQKYMELLDSKRDHIT